MYPVLFSLGPITVYTYGVCIALGIISGIVVLYYQCVKHSLNFKFLTDRLFIIFIFPLLISRLVHVLLYWKRYRTNLLEILYIWDGGYSFWVAIIMIIAATLFVTHRYSQIFHEWMDQIFKGVYFVIFFSFIGYTLSIYGDSSMALGFPTDMPWGLLMDSISSPFANVPVHPLLLYMAAISLLLGLFGSTTKLHPGIFWTMSTIILGIAGIIVETLKWEIRYQVGDFNVNITLIAILIIISLTNLYVVIKTKTAES